MQVRPAKSNAYPMTVVVAGHIAAGAVHVEVSPTVERDVWLRKKSVDPGQALPYSFTVDEPYERIRALTSSTFDGTASVFVVPGA